jgi:hypothetical protein
MATKTPKTPVEPQTCGEPAEDGQNCNLPKGHEGDHTFIAPKRDETPPEQVAEAIHQVFDEEAVQRPVIAALARIMAQLPVLQPEGRNAHFGYGFIKDTQVSGALRPRMAKEGLMVIPNVLEESWVETKTGKGGISYVTKLKVEFTVIHAASGDSIWGVGFGYGDDSGDKGANKAMTAAMKYWLLKLFQIGGEDLEDDQRADLRAANREAGSTSDVGVKIEDANIEGIQRGGRSDKMTMTQKKQIFALYKDLELTAEGFADRIDTVLGDKLVLPEGADEVETNKVMNAYINGLNAEDAGQLISGLVDEKDTREHAAAQLAADQADPGYGG